MVAPNPLPTPSLALLKEGYALLVTVATVLLFWIVGLVFARKADRNDATKVKLIFVFCFSVYVILVGNPK